MCICDSDDLGATIFFQLVSARYERGSIILTSNKSYGDWGSIFGDTIIATAILDRLLHHSTTINIRGERYRLKDRRRAGLLPTREQDGREPTAVSVATLRTRPPKPIRKFDFLSSLGAEFSTGTLRTFRPVLTICEHEGQR